MRFRQGRPEKIGGWEKDNVNTYLGTARALHSWVDLESTRFLGLGTTWKYYVNEGNSYYDVTPLRTTTSAGDVTFSATNGDATITVTDSSHGAVKNDFVTFSGAATLGGLITANVLNLEYQIATIVNTNSYTIEAKDTDGDTVTANSSDSGNGGSSVVGAYQINVGIDDYVPGSGWGAGTWGRGTWGSAATSVAGGGSIRVFGQDNFGEDLIFNVRDGSIYYWDRTNGITTRAVELSTLDTNAPTIARKIIVSDRDRHVLAFGTNAIGSSTQDKLLIRFSTQENPFDWNPTATNTAGDLLVGTGSEIVAAIETRREIIVLTDTFVHSLQFVGPPFIFGLTQISLGSTIIGPNAAVAVNDAVFWMGRDSFYVYAGQTAPLPCTVKDKVFLDFNFEQKDKVHVGLNTEFSEIIWFYPTASSTDIDAYVAYNYMEKVWYYGTLARDAWLDRGIRDLPLATGGTYLYNHETGYDDDGSAMTAYIESAPMDIGDGDKFVSIKQLIPDITFDGSTSVNPAVSFTVKAKNYSGGDYDQSGSGTAQRSATSPVEQFTNKLDYRIRGRSFAIKVESTDKGSKFKLGTPRVDMREDGRR